MIQQKNMDAEKLPNDLCTFCYVPESRPILFEKEDSYIIPTLGCFVEGYVLLNHQEHLDCYGEAVSEDIVTVKNKIRDTLEREYGSCSFFEHGRAGNCFQRASNRICYHAHLHCLPVPTDFSDRIADDHEQIEVDQWTDIAELSDEYPHYMYYENNRREMYFYPVDGSLERQYLRKRACEELGLPEESADWQENPMRDKLRATAEALEGNIK